MRVAISGVVPCRILGVEAKMPTVGQGDLGWSFPSVFKGSEAGGKVAK